MSGLPSTLAASVLLAFGLTLILIRLLAPLAFRAGLLDRPALRKLHAQPVPLTGGIAMAMGFTLSVLTLDIALPEYRAFFLAAGVIVFIGVMDDFQELSSTTRFAAQIGAGLIMVYWGDVRIIDFGALRADGGLAELGLWVVPLTVFSTVGVINALNMIDGLDGLAGSMALVAVAGLAYVAFAAGRYGDVCILLLLAAVLVSFLLANAPLREKREPLTFMGDAGSMFIGFAITWFVIDLSQGVDRAMTPVTALWLLLVPLFDTVRLLFMRPLRGQSPFRAGFDHLHHTLARAGLGQRAAVGLMSALALVAACFGFMAPRYGISEWQLFYGFLALFGVYVALMAWLQFRDGDLDTVPRQRRRAMADRRDGAQRRLQHRRLDRDRREGRDRRN